LVGFDRDEVANAMAQPFRGGAGPGAHEASYELLRTELEAQQTVPLRKTLGSTGDGPRRAAMVECLIAGMILTRYIYRLEPAASLPAPVFKAAFANSLQQAITGPVTTKR
jgi:Tetracyclin repressor-like, C-terminal domain